MSKHDEISAATRAQLIALGRERFPLLGFTALSVRSIIAGSGLGIGAFYYHFPSKEEFFLQVLEEISRDYAEVAGTSELPDPLEHAVSAAVATIAAPPISGGMSLAIAEFAVSHQDRPDYRERLAALRERTLGVLTGYITRLQEAGLVRAGAPAAELASMAFATAEGYVYHQAIYGDGLDSLVPTVAELMRERP